MSKNRNTSMFGGSEKDPNIAEYERTGNPEQGVAGADPGSPEGVKPPDAAPMEPPLPEPKEVPFLESERLVKIPLDWGQRFAIAYDNGTVVEYGLGKFPAPVPGAKPTHYLMEALE
jgi:hypothetical protein